MSELLTIAQAAVRRGCSEAAIREAVRDGRLPPFDAPDGERYVWAADVEALDPPRHVNRSSGEPVVTEAEVPGDDEAIRAAFDADEIGLLSYCLHYTLSRARLHISKVPIARRLIRRFDRMTTGGTH